MNPQNHRLLKKRLLSVGLALGVLSTALAATPAQAQMSGILLEYGARGAPGTASNTYFVNWPVSIAECQSNTPIQVQINGAPFTGVGGSLVYDLWTGGTGPAPAACQTATNRRSITGTPPCTRIDFAGPMVTGVQQTVSLNPQDLFGVACTASGDSSFFLMAVSTANDTTTDLTTANYVVLRIVQDGSAPGAPTVSNASGDSAIAVGWTLPDTGTLSEARVFVDLTATSCAGGDGGVSGSTLVAGGIPPSSAYTTVTGGSPTSATIDGAALGLAYGQTAAVAVSIRDLARNESVLSNVACITRIQVEGFWDTYCRENGLTPAECTARYNGCSVSAAGVGGRSAGSPGLLALMVGFLLAVRSVSRARTARRRHS